MLPRQTLYCFHGRLIRINNQMESYTQLVMTAVTELDKVPGTVKKQVTALTVGDRIIFLDYLNRVFVESRGKYMATHASRLSNDAAKVITQSSGEEFKAYIERVNAFKANLESRAAGFDFSYISNLAFRSGLSSVKTRQFLDENVPVAPDNYERTLSAAERFEDVESGSISSIKEDIVENIRYLEDRANRRQLIKAPGTRRTSFMLSLLNINKRGRNEAIKRALKESITNFHADIHGLMVQGPIQSMNSYQQDVMAFKSYLERKYRGYDFGYVCNMIFRNGLRSAMTLEQIEKLKVSANIMGAFDAANKFEHENSEDVFLKMIGDAIKAISDIDQDSLMFNRLVSASRKTLFLPTLDALIDDTKDEHLQESFGSLRETARSYMKQRGSQTLAQFKLDIDHSVKKILEHRHDDWDFRTLCSEIFVSGLRNGETREMLARYFSQYVQYQRICKAAIDFERADYDGILKHKVIEVISELKRLPMTVRKYLSHSGSSGTVVPFMRTVKDIKDCSYSPFNQYFELWFKDLDQIARNLTRQQPGDDITAFKRYVDDMMRPLLEIRGYSFDYFALRMFKQGLRQREIRHCIFNPLLATCNYDELYQAAIIFEQMWNESHDPAYMENAFVKSYVWVQLTGVTQAKCRGRCMRFLAAVDTGATYCKVSLKRWHQ